DVAENGRVLVFDNHAAARRETPCQAVAVTDRQYCYTGRQLRDMAGAVTHLLPGRHIAYLQYSGLPRERGPQSQCWRYFCGIHCADREAMTVNRKAGAYHVEPRLGARHNTGAVGHVPDLRFESCPFGQGQGFVELADLLVTVRQT